MHDIAPRERARVRLVRIALPDPADDRLPILAAPESMRAAEWRVLAHRVARSHGLHTLLVTSAAPGEGKSTCAANLALALAEGSARRVLLVEANLWRPSLSLLLGVTPPDCFAAQLARHADDEDAPWTLVEVAPSLHLALALPEVAGEGIVDGPHAVRSLRALGRTGYDHVILDAPQVLGAADVNLLEEAADGVLVTAWAGHTSARALRRTVKQLAPAPLVGFALLGAPEDA